jgi:hypothetical protein
MPAFLPFAGAVACQHYTQHKKHKQRASFFFWFCYALFRKVCLFPAHALLYAFFSDPSIYPDPFFLTRHIDHTHVKKNSDIHDPKSIYNLFILFESVHVEEKKKKRIKIQRKGRGA